MCHTHVPPQVLPSSVSEGSQLRTIGVVYEGPIVRLEILKQLSAYLLDIELIMSSMAEKYYDNAEVIRKKIFSMYKEMVDSIRFVFQHNRKR